MKPSAGRVLAWVASLVVAAACVGAFLLMDPPSLQRKQKLDNRRVSDLQRIEMAIDAHYRREDALPPNLAALDSAAPWIEIASDPETGSAYRYERIDDTHYRLCAEFDAKSTGARHHRGVQWEHPAGLHCFERDRRKDPEL